MGPVSTPASFWALGVLRGLQSTYCVIKVAWRGLGDVPDDRLAGTVCMSYVFPAAASRVILGVYRFSLGPALLRSR